MIYKHKDKFKFIIAGLMLIVTLTSYKYNKNILENLNQERGRVASREKYVSKMLICNINKLPQAYQLDSGSVDEISVFEYNLSTPSIHIEKINVLDNIRYNDIHNLKNIIYNTDHLFGIDFLTGYIPDIVEIKLNILSNEKLYSEYINNIEDQRKLENICILLSNMFSDENFNIKNVKTLDNIKLNDPEYNESIFNYSYLEKRFQEFTSFIYENDQYHDDYSYLSEKYTSFNHNL